MINKRYYKKLGGFSYLLAEVEKSSAKNKPTLWLMVQ